ncbi:Pearli, putative isoform 1 [Hibiscus syriacus]|uniref:Pearli, putative isoform 1 n=1 Tax=Hibiscus syriacus TaxID=106335 RepID=A0A6A2ZNN8_HIBSY|nr:Pearli, putative isoform 1 [Hibiscus syriacus]
MISNSKLNFTTNGLPSFIKSQFQLHSEEYWTRNNTNLDFNFTTKDIQVKAQFHDEWAIHDFNFTTEDIVPTHPQFQLHNGGYRDHLRLNFTTKGLPSFRANFNFTAKDIGLKTTQTQFHDEVVADYQQTISQLNFMTKGPPAVSTSRRRESYTQAASISRLDFNFTTKDVQLKQGVSVNKLSSFRVNFNFTAEDIGLEITQLTLEFNFTTKDIQFQGSTSRRRGHIQLQLHNKGYRTLTEISSLLKTNHQSQNQRVSLPLPQTSNITSKSCLAFGSSIRVPAFSASQWINRKQTTVFTSHAQLNDVVELSSNSVAAINTKPKVSSPKEDGKKLTETAIPDAVAISAFMEQVLGLVKLVDSRDVIELQLKQSDCYLDDEDVTEPLRAMVMGAPSEDARHLAQRYDRMRREAEAHAIEVSKRQARVRAILGKEVTVAMTAVEAQQQRLTLQRLIAMVEASVSEGKYQLMKAL